MPFKCIICEKTKSWSRSKLGCYFCKKYICIYCYHNRKELYYKSPYPYDIICKGCIIDKDDLIYAQFNNLIKYFGDNWKSVIEHQDQVYNRLQFNYEFIKNSSRILCNVYNGYGYNICTPYVPIKNKNEIEMLFMYTLNNTSFQIRKYNKLLRLTNKYCRNSVLLLNDKDTNWVEHYHSIKINV